MTPQKFECRQERQTKDSEIVTLDLLEQLNARAFKLVGTHARGSRISDFLEIAVEEPIRE
jgi:hypothetical protein